MSHSCRAIIFACIDFRLHDALHQRANEKYGPTGYDLVHIAGGGGSFLAADAVELMLKQVSLSIKLHGTSEVVLVNHEDCGAYGGKAAFSDDNAERQQHQSDLEAAAALIAARYPEVTVSTAFQRLDGVTILFQ